MFYLQDKHVCLILCTYLKRYLQVNQEMKSYTQPNFDQTWWKEISQPICIRNQMISSAIWNTYTYVSTSNFLRLQKIAWACRASTILKGKVQFVVSEKLVSVFFLFQNAGEKSFDYLLIISKRQFLSRFSIYMTNGGIKLHQLYWMKIWHVNSSKKFIHSLQVIYESWAAVSVKSSLYSQLNWLKNLTTKRRKKLPILQFDAAFLPNVFKWLRNCEQSKNLPKKTRVS